MKQRNAIAATLLSLFIPFYIIYWFYVAGKQLETKGAKVPNILLLLAPFLLIFGMIFIALGGTASGSDEGAIAGFALMMPLLILVSLGFSLYYYYKFGEAVEHVTNRALTKGLLFILFWFIAPAGVFLVQDKLNSMAEAGGPSAGSPTPPSDTTPTSPDAATPPSATPTPPTTTNT